MGLGLASGSDFRVCVTANYNGGKTQEVLLASFVSVLMKPFLSWKTAFDISSFVSVLSVGVI